jgi:hypothetical protein
MRADFEVKLSAVCRALLLMLLAGHLLLRQTFAHCSLGQIPLLFGGGEIGLLQHAYITEVCLLLMTPAAVWVLWRRAARENSARLHPDHALPVGMPGWPFWLAAAFGLWGAGHALAALFSPGATAYQIFRHTAMTWYALFFLHGLLFFYRREHIRAAALTVVAAGMACAVIDALAQNFPALPVLSFFDREKPWGQATLPAVILCAVLCMAAVNSWPVRILALLALGLAGWRQSLRMQSVVPISLAFAFGVYILMGVLCALRGQAETLKRGILCVALLALLAWAGLAVRNSLHPVSEDDRTEVRAWGLAKYRELYQIYEQTEAPAYPRKYVYSTRDAVAVSDPEVYKLNAVFLATGVDVSVRNNIWRFLVWRRMWQDWQKAPVAGAGPGRAWWYGPLYHTQFNYGDPGLGLDPHNSFLHLLYRHGLVGLGLLLALIGAVFYAAWKVLRDRQQSGNPQIEGLLLCFCFTIGFACFTVALEGPSYAMPFWFSAALLYARAKMSAE